MPSTQHSPKQNQLLAELTASDYESILPHLELLPIPRGWSACDSGVGQSNVYFPTNSIISLIHAAANGNTAEVAVTGNDGLVGIPLLMGEDTTGRTIARSAGFAYRLPFSALKTRFEQGGPLQDLLLRYAQSLMTQIAQTVICNRCHTLEQRLCRWLLMSLDRLPSAQLTTTRRMMADMLNAHRDGVTEATRRLQMDGAISYSHGRITVIDRFKLEAWACECYSVVSREAKRLLSGKTPRSARRPGMPSPTAHVDDHRNRLTAT